jgi:uncharacterized membrane protein YjdF
MKDKKKRAIIFILTITYMIGFIFLGIINQNKEFLFYTLIILTLISILILNDKKLRLPSNLLAGLSFFGFIHVLGGIVYIQEVRLYDLWLLNGFIRYDNLVHFVGSFFSAYGIHYLISPYLTKEAKENKFIEGMIIVLATLGIGAIHEIIELITVIYLQKGPEIGGYFNNALDLVYNMIGSIIAVLWFNRKTLINKFK